MSVVVVVKTWQEDGANLATLEFGEPAVGLDVSTDSMYLTILDGDGKTLALVSRWHYAYVGDPPVVKVDRVNFTDITSAKEGDVIPGLPTGLTAVE